MKAAVIVFPGSNCDRDVAVAVEAVMGVKPAMVWHRDGDLPAVDLIVLPGGFSHGDYLRSGAMAARAPVMRAVAARAKAGVRVLGICNGFQILTEAQMLPGALIRNSGLKFICRSVALKVENTDSDFTRSYRFGQVVTIPIAHADGNYRADADTLKRLEDNGQIAFRYVDNPNGSANDIAGVFNESRTILGLMPHPERVAESLHGGTDGRAMFEALAVALAA
ncbi:Phosphoribosylformylglycinamidine synthase subunit PurQ [uncultured Gammaproteobacteria bacterium]